MKPSFFVPSFASPRSLRALPVTAFVWIALGATTGCAVSSGDDAGCTDHPSADARGDATPADASRDAATSDSPGDARGSEDATTADVETPVDASVGEDSAVPVDAAGGEDSATPVDAGSGDSGTPDAGTRPIGRRIESLTPSGPIVAHTGQTIRGLHITSTSGPCILVNDASDVHIEDNEIGPCGAPGDREAMAVAAERSHDVFIEHNDIHDVASAFYALDTNGPVANMVFDHNRVGSVFGPLPRGQMVQFNEVHGSGIRVTCNVHDQEERADYYAEDHINLYRTSGTASSPIEIGFNRIRGFSGGSTSGCGILLGDAGGSYVNTHDNVIVNPGGCGFGVASGHHIDVARTHVFMAEGMPYSEIGAYIWNQYADACTSNSLVENRTYAYRRSGTANHFWNADNCTDTTIRDNTWGDGSLNAAIFDRAYPECE